MKNNKVISKESQTEFEQIVEQDVKRIRNEYLPLLNKVVNRLPLDQRAEQRNVFIDGISAAVNNVLMLPTITNQRRFELVGIRTALGMEYMIYLKKLNESAIAMEKKETESVSIIHSKQFKCEVYKRLREICEG
jgi:hypothetical protein